MADALRDSLRRVHDRAAAGTAMASVWRSWQLHEFTVETFESLMQEQVDRLDALDDELLSSIAAGELDG